MVSSARARGDQAEQQALQYLQDHGLVLVERNYRCRWGEIDLIMRDGDSLVFVEVRFRRQNYFGNAAASVTRVKQSRLKRSAQHYLCNVMRDLEALCRIDVIAVDTGAMNIDWIRNAFGNDS